MEEEEDNNLSVRDAVNRLERSISTERSASLRTSHASSTSAHTYSKGNTSSSSTRLQDKREHWYTSEHNQQKRIRAESHDHSNHVAPAKDSDSQRNPLFRRVSRESTALSLGSSIDGQKTNDNDRDKDISEEHYREESEEERESREALELYNTYLQWEFLYYKAQVAAENRSIAIKRELDLCRKAVAEKRRLERETLEEEHSSSKDSSSDVRIIVQQASQLLSSIKEKHKQAKGVDMSQEKEELRGILDRMNDLRIPITNAHKGIQGLALLKQNIQTVIRMI